MNFQQHFVARASLVLVLVFFLLGMFCKVGAAAGVSCPTRLSPRETPVSRAEGTGLSPLLASTRMSRRSIFNQELPYDAIRKEISGVYNVSTLKVSWFIIEWLKYSTNAFYLTGFIGFVAVTVPLVLLFFWLFWRCCYEAEGEGCLRASKSQSEDWDRGWSVRTIQGVAWTLFAAVLILVVVQVVFVVILLLGNSYVHEGVEQGRGAVSSILPEIDKVKRNAMVEAGVMIVDEYEGLLTNIYLMIKAIPEQIDHEVQKHDGTTLENFYKNVTDYLQYLGSWQEQTSKLYQFVQDLSPFTVTPPSEATPTSPSPTTTFLAALSADLQDLKQACTEVASSNVSSPKVEDECRDLLERSNGTAYTPAISSTVPELGGRLNSSATYLEILNHLLSDASFSEEAMTKDVYTDYLEDLFTNFSCRSNSTLAVYLGNQSTLYSNLTFLWTRLLVLNSSISLGLPTSQEMLTDYLGPRYLQNWEEFRNTCTVIFAVVVVVLLIWLVIYLLRALYLLYELHVEGDVQAGDVLHTTGNAIIKLSFTLTAICVISALSAAACLVIAGGVGQSCHPHGNLSHVLQLVVDDTSTWRGSYLLGQAIQGNSSFPLTFEKFLGSCRRNDSLYQVLKLDQKFYLDAYFSLPSTAMMMQFDKDLRALWNAIDDFVPLSPLANTQIRLLGEAESVPVRWQDFLSVNVSHGIFADSFVGIKELQQKLSRMSSAAQTPPTSNLSVALEKSLDSLTSLMAHLTSDLLPSVHSSAVNLSQQVGGNRSRQLVTDGHSLAASVSLRASTTARTSVSETLERTTRQLSTYFTKTISALTCDIGSCHSLSKLADRFTFSVCGSLVQGMDLYWSSLLALLFFTLIIMVLAFILASCLVDHTHEKSTNNKFNLPGAILRQIRAFAWLGVGVVVNSWLLVAIHRNEYFQKALCSAGSLPGCCPACVWAMGVVFLVLSFVVGMVSRIYQCIILQRLSNGVKKVRRYWMDQKKAAQFYGQGAVLFLQDFPFLILAGIYTNTLGILTIEAFLALVVAILGSSSYILYFVAERGNVLTYFNCLRNKFRRTTKFQVHGADSGGGGSSGGGGRGSNGQAVALNFRTLNGRYVINSESDHSESDSQGTTQHVDDLIYDPTHHAGNHVEHRLSVIPEHIEGDHHGGILRGSQQAGLPGLGVGGEGGVASVDMASSSPVPGGLITVPVYVHPQDSDVETTFNDGIRLDRTNSPTNSALHHRREMAEMRGGAGFEVASIRQYDTSSASGFGSKMSMTASGYCSSSQPPDDMYESSDYRDDDSDYSLRPNRLRLPAMPCEMSVEV